MSRVRPLASASMETAVCSAWSLPSLTGAKTRNIVKRNCPLTVKNNCDFWVNNARTRRIRRRRRRTRVAAVPVSDVVTTVLDPAPVEVTWQIVVGAIAGVAPFVVAGIEFSKRIIAQRRCEECGGSGLVLREKTYFRCPECGGFLPWQSWKRFFSG